MNLPSPVYTVTTQDLVVNGLTTLMKKLVINIDILEFPTSSLTNIPSIFN